MENLLSSPTHSVVGRRPTGEPMWAVNENSDNYLADPAASSDVAQIDESPMDALVRSLQAVRQYLFTGGGSSQAILLEQPLPPDFDLGLFVSRREYDNGRLLLMRNTRTIPSLCRLVAASNFLPSSQPSSSTSTSSQVGNGTNVATQTATGYR